MGSVEQYVALHRAECAVVSCIPNTPEWLGILEFLSYPLAIAIGLAGFVLSGLSRRLAGWLTRKTWKTFFKDGVYAAALACFVWIGSLPVGYWKRFELEQTSGPVLVGPLPPGMKPPTAAEQHFMWIEGEIESLYPIVILAFIAVPIVLMLIRSIPRWYWVLPAVVFTAWVGLLADRDDFEVLRPLPDGALAADIGQIAEAAGIAPDRIMVGDAKFMTGLNTAYVSWQQGRQIAVIGEPYFNTLPFPPANVTPLYKPVTAAEARAVAAHEIAHLKHNHLLIGPLIAGAFGFLGCFLAALVVRRGRAAVGERGSAPAIALAFGTAFMLMVPVRANIWRIAEHQADATALDIGREPLGFVLLALRTSRGELLDRRRVSHVVLGTHPDGLDRIERAVEWGETNRPVQWRAGGISGPVRERTRSGFKFYYLPDDPSPPTFTR